MRMALKRIGKLSRWVLVVLLALAILYAGIIAFPSPMFAHEARFGEYRIYADEPFPDDIEQVIEDTVRRLDAMEHDPPEAGQRIYLCHSPRLYAFFAFLTRKSPESLAISLSVVNETFVRMDRVRLFAERNRGVLRHTRFEGNLAEIIAHEIAHFNSVRDLGYRAHLAQPVWKSEGWAEYTVPISEYTPHAHLGEVPRPRARVAS